MYKPVINMSFDGDRKQLIGIENYVRNFANEYFNNNFNTGYFSADPFYQELLYTSISTHIKVHKGTYFVSNGISELFKTLLKIIKPGTILGLSYQFPPFVEYIKIMGFKYVEIINPDFSFPTQQLLQGIKNMDVSSVIIERPLNFSGLTASIDELKQIIEYAQTKNIPIIVDESYANYLPNEDSATQLLIKFDNLIVLRSNAKGYNLGGFRTGIIFFGSSSTAELYKKFHREYTPDLFSINLFKSLLCSDIHNKIAKLCSLIAANKKTVCNCLEKHGYKYLPSHTSMPVLVIYHPKINIAQQFKQLNIISTNIRCYNFGQSTISYSRIRIPSNSSIIKNFCMAIKRFNQQ